MKIRSQMMWGHLALMPKPPTFIHSVMNIS